MCITSAISTISTTAVALVAPAVPAPVHAKIPAWRSKRIEGVEGCQDAVKVDGPNTTIKCLYSADGNGKFSYDQFQGEE